MRLRWQRSGLRTGAAGDVGEVAAVDDAQLLKRIVDAYQFSAERFPGYGESMWRRIGALTYDVDRQLMAGSTNALRTSLRYPHTTDLFYGFEELGRTRFRQRERNRRKPSARIYHRLVQLAEAVGAIRTINPEQPGRWVEDLSVERLLSALDETLGVGIAFPNPFPLERGIATKRGVISDRAVAAIYQAYRLKELTRCVANPRVLEIGAGLGRTAFYAAQFGITDYTIIDLPMTNVAQANFLGRVLPGASIALAGETSDGTIRIFDATWRPAIGEKFDIALNADSLTEMDRAVATDYIDLILRHSTAFLSINHEINPFTVADLLKARGVPAVREKHWLREGYVEETVGLNVR